MQRELSPQATEGLFLSCEFCNPSASRCSAPPFTQGRRKVVVVAFATAVQICKCQTFSEGFQPCQHHALIGLSKPPALPVVMTTQGGSGRADNVSSSLPRQAGIAQKSAQCCELLHTERYNMLKTIHFHYIFGK